MPRILKTLGVALALILIVLIGARFGQMWYQGRQFARLEQNAGKVITAQELQAWALRLLSEYRSYPSAQAYRMIRTNYPPQLRTLVPGLEPDVTVNEVNSTNSGVDWTNFPSTVSLIWGSGPIGHRGFLIGPTNFDYPGEHVWSPGVYFLRR